MSICALVLRTPPPGYTVHGIGIETVKGAERKAVTVSNQSKQAAWRHRLLQRQSNSATPRSPTSVASSLDRNDANKETSIIEAENHVVVSVLPEIDYSPYFAMTLMEALSSIQFWMIVRIYTYTYCINVQLITNIILYLCRLVTVIKTFWFL